jgi:hypothetical protein
MQQEDDLRGLAKVMEFMRAVSILFCVINVYGFCYQYIVESGVNIGVLDRILMNFQRTTGLFSSILWTKLFAVVFLALSCLETKGVKEEKITWNKIYVSMFFGFILFFLNWWLLYLPLPLVANTALYVFTLTLGYILLLVAGIWMSRLLKNDLMSDVFNTENESFMQETRLLENGYSVNLPTRFFYKKKWNKGWINVVNPFRYSAALGLYNSRIVKLINKKGQLKSSVIIDELLTIYFRGLDNLIATARSNKVAVCLGFQDFSQLKCDYGDKEAAVVMNTVGSIFSGQVVGELAKNLSERFGKVLQKRQSMTINRQDKSTSISTQLDSLIPASKISNLTQGMFVGSVSDNFDERIEQKIFHAEIVVDNAKIAAETKAYRKIPQIVDFCDENGTDRMQEQIDANYNQIKADVKQIVADELARIENDPELQHLRKKE